MNEKKRPNILFIMTDEQRYDTLGHVNEEIRTPRLDELIGDSVFFSNAHCSNPSCIPSRAAIMTGKYPTQCQVPTYITKLPKEEITFMNRLRDAGYHTAVAGKQHFAHSGIDRGYDEEWIVDGHDPDGDPEEIKLYVDWLKEEGVWGTDHSDYSLMLGGEWQWDMKYHIDSYVAELGKDWLRKRKNGDEKQDKPWFFTLSFPGPHMPFDCEGTPYAEGYELDRLSLPESTYEDLDAKPPHFKQMKPAKYVRNHSVEKYKKTKRAYYANMTLIDEKVGYVIDLLKDKGLYDETLIIYTADHGDFMGDFGMVSKAQYLTEGLMRVPLFVKPPLKGFKGYGCDDDVLNIDIAATCLDVAEGKMGRDMSDYSYAPYWRKDSEPKKRDHVYYEAGGMKGVIKDGVKVVHYQNRPYGEIYNLAEDPAERINLWDRAEYGEHKMNALALIIDKMIEMSPKSEIRWNVNDPDL